MQDSKIQTVLLFLLRAGLWKEREIEDDVFSLSPAEWTDVYRASERHTIEGVVFDGVQRLPVEIQPQRELLLKWIVRVDQIERHNKKMNTCIKEQLDIFASKQIYPVLLKGQGVAACYDIPEHRVCGDVDWYFERKPHYAQANEIFLQRGV